MTMRFEENLRIGVIQGEVTLNCEKMISIIEPRAFKIQIKLTKFKAGIQ